MDWLMFYILICFCMVPYIIYEVVLEFGMMAVFIAIFGVILGVLQGRKL